MDTMDALSGEQLTIFDQEHFMVEDGEFVGITAIVNEDAVIPTNGRLPAGY